MTTKKIVLREQEVINDEEIALEALPPCIPPGLYDAVILSNKKVRAFQNRWCVVFTFRIVEQGQYFDVRLPGYANLGNDRKTVRPCGKLASWCRLIANRSQRRQDRISLNSFRNFYFKVEVSTVVHNSRQQDLPERDRYSIVSDIKDIIGEVTNKNE